MAELASFDPLLKAEGRRQKAEGRGAKAERLKGFALLPLPAFFALRPSPFCPLPSAVCLRRTCPNGQRQGCGAPVQSPGDRGKTEETQARPYAGEGPPEGRGRAGLAGAHAAAARAAAAVPQQVDQYHPAVADE